MNKTSAGIYMIRFVPPFRAVPSVQGSAEAAANYSVQQIGAAPESVELRCYNAANATVDALIAFVATGRA